MTKINVQSSCSDSFIHPACMHGICMRHGSPTSCIVRSTELLTWQTSLHTYYTLPAIHDRYEELSPAYLALGVWYVHKSAASMHLQASLPNLWMLTVINRYEPYPCFISIVRKCFQSKKPSWSVFVEIVLAKDNWQLASIWARCWEVSEKIGANAQCLAYLGSSILSQGVLLWFIDVSWVRGYFEKYCIPTVTMWWSF